MSRLRAQMFLSIALGVLILNTLFAIIILAQLNRLPEAFRTSSLELTQARAGDVSKELNDYVELLNLLTYLPDIQAMDLDVVDGYLSDIAATHPAVRNYTLIDLQGHAFSTDGRTFNVADQLQYQDIIIEGKRVSISDPFISPHITPSTKLFIVAHEVRQEGALVGILNMVIPLEDFIAVFDDSGLQADGKNFIITRSLELLSSVNQPTLEESLQETNLQTLLDADTQGRFSYTEDGQEREAFFASIEANPEWFIVLSFDARAIAAPYRNAINTFVIGISLLVLAAMIYAYYFSAKVAKPILALQHTFDKAAQGNLNVVADTSQNNELGDAAHSFNTMIRQIKELTYYDPITGLYNLNTFLLELPRYVQQPEIADRIKGLIIVSIDDFKRINTINGYKTGDLLLNALAQRISQHLGVHEMIGRFYGDEMIILMHASSWSALQERVESLFKVIHQPFAITEQRYALRLSLGVSVIDANTEFLQTIHQATIAKVQVKKASGHGIEYYNDHINYQLIEEQNMEDALFLAVQEQQFTLVYQPIIHTKTGDVIAYEALLRWTHPDYQNVPIIQVIEMAERTGVIHSLGTWIIDQALQDLKRLKSQGDVMISLNISALQLTDNALEVSLTTLMEKHQIKANEIILEITETSLMSTHELDIEHLEALKATGLKLAVDDFGTGYSSLAYLSTLTLDFLKIDRRFISRLTHDQKAHDIVKTIVSLGHILNLQVIAEGVETDEELSLIKAMNCEFSQGYHHAKPQSLDAIIKPHPSKDRS